MRHVAVTISTPDEATVLDKVFVSVPESDLPPEEEVVEALVESFQCAESMENLLKIDLINAVTEKEK